MIRDCSEGMSQGLNDDTFKTRSYLKMTFGKQNFEYCLKFKMHHLYSLLTFVVDNHFSQRLYPFQIQKIRYEFLNKKLSFQRSSPSSLYSNRILRKREKFFIRKKWKKQEKILLKKFSCEAGETVWSEIYFLWEVRKYL